MAACRSWYATHLGLRTLPIREHDIVFLTDGRDIADLGWYTTTIDLWAVARWTLAIGAAVVVLLMADGATLDNAAKGALGAMLVAAAYLPLFVRRARLIVNCPKHPSREEVACTLIHELAHAYHDRWLRGWWHAVLDLILWPLGLSYSEGIATWVEAEYCRSVGLRYEVRGMNPRYRRSYRVTKAIERAVGRRMIVFLLNYV